MPYMIGILIGLAVPTVAKVAEVFFPSSSDPADKIIKYAVIGGAGYLAYRHFKG